MYNYDHEIPLMEDAGMRKFLWCDYFHDSIISDVGFDTALKKSWRAKDVLTLTVCCDRDCETACQTLPAKAHPADRQQFLTCGKFTYLVSFHDVQFFQFHNNDCTMVYLNGRFKDTRIVRELNANRNRPYYHFRIQLTGGYIDLVFHSLKIRKAEGRVSYAMKDVPFDLTPHGRMETIAERNPVPTKEADDWDCFFAMQKMYRAGDPRLAGCARQWLKTDLPVEDAKPYAAYVLGKVGNPDDLALIRPVYFEAKEKLQKRHILDAIELLEAQK